MSMVYNEETAIKSSIEYFGGEELPARTWVEKYALRNEKDELVERTPDDTHRRIAKEFARIESKKFKKPYSEDFIYNLLKDFKYIVPQGSPMYGIGNPYKYISLSNCYVLTQPLDSYSSILDVDKELVNICKRRGGVGISLDNLRPRSTPVKNAAKSSTGVVSFMERYSNSIREVGQNNRRGALMLSLNIHHPESISLLEEDPKNVVVNPNMEHLNINPIHTTTEFYNPHNPDFASIKYDRTKVTGANVSLALTDEFMKAVESNKDYEQRWPLKNPKIKKKVNAKKSWDKIIGAAWQMAEPGLLFWDNFLKYGPADIYEEYRSISTNPCAELPLCSHDSCRLLILVLLSFVENAFTKDAYFNFPKFYEYAQCAQRLMDDLVDLEAECIERIINKIENDPEPKETKQTEIDLWKKILKKNNEGRRTGTGITALGDCLAALGIKYGSKESIEMTEKIYKCLKFGCYRSSINMAKELGPFKCWNPELEIGHPFIDGLKSHLELSRRNENGAVVTSIIDGFKLYDEMMKYGRRNIALTTTAPTGSMSILTQTSSGIEPIFMLVYIRNRKVTEGGEYDYIDAMGDKWKQYKVYHKTYYKWLEKNPNKLEEDSPWYGACANEIDWISRVKLQAVAQKHICHSISSTINLPNDVTKEKVAEIYMTAWKMALKGITVYRDGCRTGVLVSNNKISKNDAIKRPKSLIGDIYYYNNIGVVVGKIDDRPYEVFLLNDFKPTKKQKQCQIIKLKQKHYKLISDDELLLENAEAHCDKEQEAMARLTSLSLRHNVDIEYIITQLSKVKGHMFDSCRAISKSLSHYMKPGTILRSETCEKCGSKNISMSESCSTCQDCGNSKCG